MNPLLKRILQVSFLVLVQALILFISSGKAGWGAGWWFVSLYVVCLLAATMLLLPRHREVIEERSKGTAGGKVWDIWLTRLMIIPTFGLLLVAGLDERFDWSEDIGVAGRAVGILFFLAGYALVVWAMAANRYFSSVVRIQSERGHAVVTGGPYHFIRHPGYTGMLASTLGSVLILESVWGFVPALLYAVLVVIRINLEDKTLRAELPGYVEFSRTTRYRLLPGIW